MEERCDEMRKNPDRRKAFSEMVRAKANDLARRNQCIAVPDLSRRVAHKPWQYWVRSDRPIVQEQVDQLVANSGSKVRWIAPVYQNPSREGRSGLFSPLPDVLVVEPTKSVDELALAEKLKSVGLREVKRRSKYYMGIHRYLRLRNRKLEEGTTVYKLLRNRSCQ